MPWTSKASNKGDNCDTPTGPNTEGRHHEYEHGKFYNGNESKSLQKDLMEEGSEGLARNHGFIRDSMIPSDKVEGDMGQTNMKRLKIQGSHSQVGYNKTKVSREI